MVISRQDAEVLILRYLDTIENAVPGGIALMTDRTIEKPYGWVFFYNSRRFLESRRPLEALLGNSPILVTAADGELIFLGTALSVSESLALLEAERGFVVDP